MGYKSGLALNKKEILRILDHDEQFEFYLRAKDQSALRIESIVYEEMVAQLLYSVGRLESPRITPPIALLHHKYKRNPRLYGIAMEISSKFTVFLNKELLNTDLVAVDPAPFFDAVTKEYGSDGLEIAIVLVEEFAAQIFRNPWSSMMSKDDSKSEWKDVIELRALFDSEKLEAQYGTFFDQRYIDYLNRNFDNIDRVNWRKFEGLTAEFFDRCGFNVTVGPGRNDDNIDIRVWPEDSDQTKPPTIAIQCKRQKAKVQKVVIKSLYADLLHEGTRSGLVITTSALAPGAKKVCEVRGYPIKAAERNTLKDWIKAMRKPGSGIVL